MLWLQVRSQERASERERVREKERKRSQVVPQVLIKNFLGLNSPGDNTCTKNHFGCVSVRHMDVFHSNETEKQKNHSTRALSKTTNFPAMMNKWLCICTRTERSLVLQPVCECTGGNVTRSCARNEKLESLLFISSVWNGCVFYSFHFFFSGTNGTKVAIVHSTSILSLQCAVSPTYLFIQIILIEQFHAFASRFLL